MDSSVKERPQRFHVCIPCGFIYDEYGAVRSGMSTALPWDELPDDWCCPDCGSGKGAFAVLDLSISGTEDSGEA